MNKNAIYAITAITAISLTLNIVTIRKLNALNRDINMRISNAENKVSNLEGERN